MLIFIGPLAGHVFSWAICDSAIRKKNSLEVSTLQLKIELFLVLKVTNHAIILEQVQEHKK